MCILGVVLVCCLLLYMLEHQDGSKELPWLIFESEQLVKLSDIVNNGDTLAAKQYYILMKDIDMSNLNTEDGCLIPIGNAANPFKGNFNGNGKVLYNLTVNRQSNDVGLFGYADNAQIYKLGLEECSISGNDHVGGLVGYLHNSEITNCYVMGNISGTIDVGGLVGRNNGAIEYCYAGGKVTGHEHVGGIAGISYGDFVMVQNCVAVQDSLISHSKDTVNRVARVSFFNSLFRERKNYAYDNMTVLQNGSEPPKTMYREASRNEGGDKSTELLQNRHLFYANANLWTGRPWDFDSVWNIGNEKIPSDSSRLPVFKYQKIRLADYSREDKEALRRFLLQESSEQNKLNLDKLNSLVKNTIDTTNWMKDDVWATQVPYIYWNHENPRRLVAIGNSEFPRDISLNPDKPLNGWNTKGLAGDLDASGWTKLAYLEIKTSSDFLNNRYKDRWNHITSLELGSHSYLRTILCERNDLSALNVSGCKALKRLVCGHNQLAVLDLSGLDFEDFSGGGQNISLTMKRNSDGSYSHPINLNNPSFYITDRTNGDPSSLSGIITYSSGSLRSTDTKIVEIGFIADTGLAGKRIGGTIVLTYQR